MSTTRQLISYSLSGVGIVGMTYELYINATYARGMNARTHKCNVPNDERSLLRQLPKDWQNNTRGSVIATECWATAPRHSFSQLMKSNAAAANAAVSGSGGAASSSTSSSSSPSSSSLDSEELLLLYANSMLASPVFSWEIFFGNLKRGKFQWSQPWTELAEGEVIGSYTVSKRTPTAVMLQWSSSAVDGQTLIAVQPEQPGDLFQLGATLFKRDELVTEKVAQSAAASQANYLRLVLAQTYTTMEVHSRYAHAQMAVKRAQEEAKARASAGKPPGA